MGVFTRSVVMYDHLCLKCSRRKSHCTYCTFQSHLGDTNIYSTVHSSLAILLYYLYSLEDIDKD